MTRLRLLTPACQQLFRLLRVALRRCLVQVVFVVAVDARRDQRARDLTAVLGSTLGDLHGLLVDAYSIALRTSGFADAGRLVFNARYSSAPDGEVATRALTAGLPVTVGISAAGTDTPVVAANLSSPASAISRRLTTSPCRPMSTTIESGRPVRASSADLSQFGFRSSSSATATCGCWSSRPTPRCCGTDTTSACRPSRWT